MKRSPAKTYVIDGTRTLSAAAIHRACVSLGSNVGVTTVRERLHAGVRNLDALCAPVDAHVQAAAKTAINARNAKRANDRAEMASVIAALDARKVHP